MLETAFTRLVGCSLPLQLAGMGSINGPELTAAVSEAGAFGQITFAGTQPKDAEARLNRIEELTSKPFGVNLIIPYFDPAILRMVVARARVVDFFWGEPDARLIDQVHAGGALASWQVGSVGEAINAEEAGCDFIIAQGIEAGGHIRGRLSLLPLLSAVLDAVSVPVLAAGGIGTARSVAAVLFAGAAGARVGTRFIAAPRASLSSGGGRSPSRRAPGRNRHLRRALSDRPLPGNRGIQASRGKDRCDGVLRRPIGRRRAACAAGRRD